MKDAINLPNDMLSWQERLESHFRTLAESRQAAGWPVFALEHELDEAAVAQIEATVRASALREQPRMVTYLPWIVYAAEFGYNYTGYEYWRSFASKTPGWTDDNAARAYFRRAFEKFAGAYGGAQPAGAWAEWFTIIAWPITHGIVPKDLQRHLVRLLYDQRFTVPRFLSRGAVGELGQHLHAASAGYSDRFCQFAANEQLIGLIATALLEQESGDEARISSLTLQRIVSDITRERAAAEWLHEARSTARKHRVIGLGSGGAPTPAFGIAAIPDAGISTASAPISTSRLPSQQRELRVLLRATASGDWDLRVEVPDLTPLVQANPRLRDVLRGRGRLCGTSRPLAGGVLLYGGAQSFPVTAWPASNEPFIQFDAVSGDLRPILDSLFTPPPGQTWLFRLQPDGKAVLLKSATVHPGESYIVLSRESHERPTTVFTKLALRPSGLSALRFTVPNRVDDVWPILLERLGLTISKKLTVWPAGVAVAAWDGEGSCECLLGEELVLGVQVDHAISAIAVSVDGNRDNRFALAAAAEEPTFLSLGSLSRGKHRIEFATVPQDAHETSLGGILDVVVRTPQTRKHGESRQDAATLLIDPPAPTLEQLWSDDYDLQLLGPDGFSLTANVRLYERGRERPLTERAVNLKLPLEPATWREVFSRLRADNAIQHAYDAAYSCRIEFNLGLLGCFSLTADRAFTPIRWILRDRGQGTTLRLIDDTGTDSAIVKRFDCRWPDNATTLPLASALAGLTAQPPGALYLAEANGHRAAIVVAPPQRALTRLQDLATYALPQPVTPEPNSLYASLTCARDWEEANLAGSSLSFVHRERVINALLTQQLAALCGDSWGRLEMAVQAGGNGAVQAVQRMRAIVVQSGAARVRDLVFEHIPASTKMELAERILFLREALRTAFPDVQPTVSISSSSHLGAADLSPEAQRDRSFMFFEFALRLASSPAAALSWTEPHTKVGLRVALGHQEVVRAARFAVLETHLARTADTKRQRRLYFGWNW